MATVPLPQDFKDFLKLLEDDRVRYLLIGEYAVGYYGYPRATADIDIWFAVLQINAEKTVKVFQRFGLKSADILQAVGFSTFVIHFRQQFYRNLWKS